MSMSQPTAVCGAIPLLVRNWRSSLRVAGLAVVRKSWQRLSRIAVCWQLSAPVAVLVTSGSKVGRLVWGVVTVASSSGCPAGSSVDGVVVWLLWALAVAFGGRCGAGRG